MKTIKAEEIPIDEDARQFLRSLDLSGGEIIIEQDGKPALVISPPDMLRQREDAKRKFFALVSQIRQEHPDLNSDDILAELEDLDSQG